MKDQGRYQGFISFTRNQRSEASNSEDLRSRLLTSDDLFFCSWENIDKHLVVAQEELVAASQLHLRLLVGSDGELREQLRHRNLHLHHRKPLTCIIIILLDHYRSTEISSLMGGHFCERALASIGKMGKTTYALARSSTKGKPGASLDRRFLFFQEPFGLESLRFWPDGRVVVDHKDWDAQIHPWVCHQ